MALTIAAGDRHRLGSMFGAARQPRAVIECVLEGHLGRAWADDANDPGVACLELGCYAIFGGSADCATAVDLVQRVVPPRELLCPETGGWEELLARAHGGRLQPRPMEIFRTGRLDLDRLRSAAGKRPDGFEIRDIDAGLAGKLGSELEPHGMQVFETTEDFATRGLGVCALHDEALVCAATSYAVSSSGVELAIATRLDVRRRGLAECVAATFMVRCLERGLTPHWSAGNPVSKRLARRLGYRPGCRCNVLYLG